MFRFAQHDPGDAERPFRQSVPINRRPCAVVTAWQEGASGGWSARAAGIRALAGDVTIRDSG